MAHGLETMMSINKRMMQMQDDRRKAVIRDIMMVLINNSKENEAGKREWTADMNTIADQIKRFV